MGSLGIAQPLESRLMGREAAAVYLNITPRTVDRLRERGILTPVRISGLRRTYFDRKELDALIDAAKSCKTSSPAGGAESIGTSRLVESGSIEG
jgi:Helix-turn-helix domain